MQLSRAKTVIQNDDVACLNFQQLGELNMRRELFQFFLICIPWLDEQESLLSKQNRASIAFL